MSFLRLVFAAALTGLLGASVAAQATDGRAFTDPDFELSLTLPPGMAELPHEAAAAAFGRDPETFNMPRSEVENGRASHSYMWTDTTGRERKLRLIAEDVPPPFGSPDHVKEFAEVSFGLTIDRDPSPLKRDQGYMNGISLQGTRKRGDGSVVRGMLAYFPAGPELYKLLYFEALDVDWDLVSADFDASLKSLKFPVAEGQGKGGQGGRPGQAGAVNADGSPVKTYEESWESLMSVFVGSKSAAAA
jgi:hypothetical protein